MNESQKRFAQRVLKPFDAFLNRLVHPFCFSAKYSSICVDMEDISTAIAHFIEGEMPGETANSVRSKLEATEPSLKRIRDFSDTRKHGSLRDPKREVVASVKSRFEYSEARGFRFLQTVPYTRYKLSRSDDLARDFVSTATSAINVLNSKLGLGVKSLREAPTSKEPFRKAATLWHDPNSEEVSVEAVNLEFVVVLDDGTIVPVDPPEVEFVVY